MEVVLNKPQIEKYPAYKDSGVEWLGEIPAHWKVLRLKYVCYLQRGHDLSKEQFREGTIPVYGSNGVIGFHNYSTTNGPCITIGRSGSVGNINFVEQDFWAHNTSLYVKESYNNNWRFLFYLLSTIDIKTESNGSAVPTLDRKKVHQTVVGYPTLPEQIAIANFLDRKTTQIDNAIRIKEKQIELLQERRQILIHRAVTRGLDPEVPMKDSGVEWIGEIPAHWEVESNRSLFIERNESGNALLPILSVSIHSAVSSEELSDQENLRGKIRIEDKSSYKLVKVNDIVFNMMRAWQGAIGAVRTEGMVSPAYVVARPKGRIDSDFFEFQYRTSASIQQMDRSSKGITDFRKRLYWNEFKQLKTILPPIDEQREISAYIISANQKTTHFISQKEQEIEKLKEYKATLINSAVTGKIKVN